MEKAGCIQASTIPKKGKKKQAKDELDRQKQAEKKRRRLEKALATSAAIRSELEKKKQKKIEEQQRLDEEGAAVAEAVALHVLVGEDAEESHHFMLNNNSRYHPWNHCGNLGLFMGYQNFAGYSREQFGWSNGSYHSESFPQCPLYEENPVGLLAAQAVASLQIAEDSGPGGATYVINRMLGGTNIRDAVDFYKEY